MVSLMIVKSEKAADLKSGIITLTTPVRHPGPISVITDWAPGFISLSKDDKELKDLHIKVILKDQLNKNFNAVVNCACQDIEGELRKLAPEGKKISESVLAKATIAVNTILRQKEGISAYELHTARSQDTGGNLHLKDEEIYANQQKVRENKLKKSSPTDIKVGDTVTPISPQEKHKARDIYLVTGQGKYKVVAQRLLHPLSQDPIKFMSREYEISPKHLHRIHRPPSSTSEIVKETDTKPIASTKYPQAKSSRTPWSPVNPKYYEDESSYDDENDDIDHDQRALERRIIVLPAIPPPSNELDLPAQNIIPQYLDSSISSIENEINLDLHLSDSDQSQDTQTVKLAEVVDNDYNTKNMNVPETSVTIHQGEDMEVHHEVVPDNELLEDSASDIINTASVLQENEEEITEDNVPDAEQLEDFVPEVTLTDEDIDYIDEYLENVCAAAVNEDFEDVPESVSDQGAEEYVRQFSPDQQVEHDQEDLEVNDDDEDDSQLRDYLKSFSYDQTSQPKKKDIIYYYDLDEETFVKVKIISKSNFRHYYNIRFLETERPDAGIYLNRNDFWSHSLPVPKEPDQEHLADLEVVQEQDNELLPPIEQERRGRHQSSHRQIFPTLYQHSISSVRSDRVYRLPSDQFRDQLSPRSKKKADSLCLPPEQEYMRSVVGRSLASSKSSAPVSRMANFMERVILGKKH